MPLQTLDRADVKDGFISGVASTPSTDAFGHSVCAGAFARSIKAKGLGGPKGVKLLAGHDWAKLIGVITRLEDALRIEAQLNLDIGYVRDLHSSIVHSRPDPAKWAGGHENGGECRASACALVRPPH